VNRDNRCGIVGVFSPGGWKRAAACGPDGGNCVEVNFSVPGVVAVRDSTQPRSPVLVVDDSEWSTFLATARAGLYDR
jgi:hypothetical protein